jgi:hypothetical protein
MPLGAKGWSVFAQALRWVGIMEEGGERTSQGLCLRESDAEGSEGTVRDKGSEGPDPGRLPAALLVLAGGAAVALDLALDASLGLAVRLILLVGCALLPLGLAGLLDPRIPEALVEERHPKPVRWLAKGLVAAGAAAGLLLWLAR